MNSTLIVERDRTQTIRKEKEMKFLFSFTLVFLRITLVNATACDFVSSGVSLTRPTGTVSTSEQIVDNIVLLIRRVLV